MFSGKGITQFGLSYTWMLAMGEPFWLAWIYLPIPFLYQLDMVALTHWSSASIYFAMNQYAPLSIVGLAVVYGVRRILGRVIGDMIWLRSSGANVARLIRRQVQFLRLHNSVLNTLSWMRHEFEGSMFGIGEGGERVLFQIGIAEQHLRGRLSLLFRDNGVPIALLLADLQAQRAARGLSTEWRGGRGLDPIPAISVEHAAVFRALIESTLATEPSTLEFGAIIFDGSIELYFSAKFSRIDANDICDPFHLSLRPTRSILSASLPLMEKT
jgi:hypothetical protein